MGANNSIFLIAPYKHKGAWVFDDETAGLRREPFVSGIPAIIDRAVARIRDADGGFLLFFSEAPFPGSDVKLDHLSEESGGNWYRAEKMGLTGWLCPALFKYFSHTPKNIYAHFLPSGAMQCEL